MKKLFLFFVFCACAVAGPDEAVQWYWNQNGVTNATQPQDYVLEMNAETRAVEITGWNTNRGIARPVLDSLMTNAQAIRSFATNREFQIKADPARFTPEMRALAEWTRLQLNAILPATNQISRQQQRNGIKAVYAP